MKLEFFEPPMCCATGVCGPNVDEKLVRLAENIQYLKEKYKDIEIERYQISQQPIKFKENSEVYSLVQKNGKKALPITTYNGKVFKSEAYPSLEEIEQMLIE